ncbi:M48 family metalloprotease [Candidatus Babeliales bacterium]|nr:M48 family metalloprotease [Candidatus Babeliales bacterium]
MPLYLKVFKKLLIVGFIIGNCFIWYPTVQRFTKAYEVQAKQYKVRQAHKVFNHMKKFMGDEHARHTKLVITGGNMLNAYVNYDTKVDKNVVHISVNLLNYQDRYKAVLAHELAHIALNHLQRPQMADMYVALDEINADKYSTYLLTKSGYNTCASYDLWKWYASTSERLLQGTHPLPIQRAAYMKFPICK